MSKIETAATPTPSVVKKDELPGFITMSIFTIKILSIHLDKLFEFIGPIDILYGPSIST